MANITLQRVTVTDADELISSNIESRDYHLPWVEPFTDRQGFDVWYNRMLTASNVYFLARQSGTREIVGVVNLNEIVMGLFQSAYLGFYGMVGSAGRGLMTEAVRIAIDTAFNEYGLHRVEANIQPANTRSIALVRRLGFRKEGLSPKYLRIAGEWRDHERWALLKEDLISGTQSF